MTPRPLQMTPRFRGAVVDTLLPGDDSVPPLPSGTAAGVAAKLPAHLAGGRDRSAHLLALDAVARQAGGEEAFVRSDAAGRASALRVVETEMREAFGSLVSLALQDYYESEPVLRAMGWRVEPPQPRGHALPPFDDALLDPVRRRGRIWRDAERPTGR